MFELRCLCCGRVARSNDSSETPEFIIYSICPTCQKRLNELVREVNKRQAERN